MKNRTDIHRCQSDFITLHSRILADFKHSALCNHFNSHNSISLVLVLKC